MNADYEGSNQIYAQVCSALAQGIDKDLSSDSILDLDLKEPIDQQFLRKQKRVSLPTLGTIKLEKLSQMSFREIKSFLKDGFPKKLTCLSLNSLKPSTIGPYLNWLKSVSYQVLSKIEITNFEISELQSRKIFRAFRHVEAIEFVSCEFSFPRVPDFSKALVETSINTLYLLNCEDFYKSDWVGNPCEFDNLITGLSRSDLQNSLQLVDFGESSLDKTFISDIFDKYRLEHVKIKGSFNFSTECLYPDCDLMSELDSIDD
ncbi:unnamed protein product [Moneuplotes crassus]|uniref:Uncharacterized protein n=1 Tax=Euplotes crassus TaxID=5936 RepID=A0AAD1Y5L6_EUPCR|nr:unnamed protein product [Moneuplotes crassus]